MAERVKQIDRFSEVGISRVQQAYLAERIIEVPLFERQRRAFFQNLTAHIFEWACHARLAERMGDEHTLLDPFESVAFLRKNKGGKGVLRSKLGPESLKSQSTPDGILLGADGPKAYFEYTTTHPKGLSSYVRTKMKKLGPMVTNGDVDICFFTPLESDRSKEINGYNCSVILKSTDISLKDVEKAAGELIVGREALAFQGWTLEEFPSMGFAFEHRGFVDVSDSSISFGFPNSVKITIDEYLGTLPSLGHDVSQTLISERGQIDGQDANIFIDSNQFGFPSGIRISTTTPDNNHSVSIEINIRDSEDASHERFLSSFRFI